MSTDSYRKCSKCGATPIKDGLLSFHRFPKAGKTNEARRRVWAKFCWPEQDWSAPNALAKIIDGKVLCKRHFRDIYFTDSTKKRLGKFAIPTEENNVTNLKITVGNETIVLPQVQGVPNFCAGRELLAKFREEEAIAESNCSKDRTAVSDHSKNQTAVSDHSKNETAVSDHSENQHVVNINEDAVDDSQYSAGVDDTGADDECHNISDDDCQAVVDDDSSFYHNVSKLSDDKENMDMKPHNLDKNEDLHDGFQCNYCSGEIKGYRYTCVQCPDYDLCGSCEARGAHCLHYVLRIPRPKPYTEIQPLLIEIRRLLSGANTDVLWTQPDEIKKEELDEDFDPLNIDVMPTSSETEYVPEMSTFTSTKSHQNKQDDNDTVPEMIIQPRLTSHEHNATTLTRQKETVTADRSAASTSSQFPRFVKIAPKRSFESSLQAIDNTRTPVSATSPYPVLARLAPQRNERPLLTFKSSPQVIDNARTTVSESSQYTASTRPVPDGNTVFTIESSLQVIDKTRTTVSASSPYPVLARLAPQKNKRPLLTIESSPQDIDKTRTPASESSLFTASTSVASDSNTVLTIATNVADTDGTSRSVPTTSKLYASTRVTAGGTETISNKTKITGDSHLQVPMATKRKCSDNIEPSKPSQVVLLKGSNKFIVVPSMSKVIGPGSKFKIINKPAATGQPQSQGTVYAARHRTRSTQRDQDAPS